MMIKPQGYDEATVGGMSWAQIETGGHVLELLRVQEADLKGYPVLEIVFDTHPSDKQPVFYKEKYDSDKEQFDSAKYQGVFNLFLPDGDPSADTYKWATSRLKGFITSVEESNPGFKFNWDPKTLKGKKVGGVFGTEEYYNRDGEIKEGVRLRYFCSVESAKTAKAPKPKTVKPQQATEMVKPAPEPELPFDV